MSHSKIRPQINFETEAIWVERFRELAHIRRSLKHPIFTEALKVYWHSNSVTQAERDRIDAVVKPGASSGIAPIVGPELAVQIEELPEEQRDSLRRGALDNLDKQARQQARAEKARADAIAYTIRRRPPEVLEEARRAFTTLSALSGAKKRKLPKD